MKPLPSLLAGCLLWAIANMTTTAAQEMILFEKGATCDDWQITSVGDVSFQSLPHETRFTIEATTEGANLWPRLTLSGPALDLSGYSRLLFEVENATSEDQSITVGAVTNPGESKAQASQIPAGKTATIALDISDGGGRIDPSRITEVILYQYKPLTPLHFSLKKITALRHPDFPSKRETLARFLGETVRSATELPPDAPSSATVPSLLDEARREFELREPGYLTTTESKLLEAQREIMLSAMNSRNSNLVIWRSPLAMAIRSETLPLPSDPECSAVQERVCIGQYKAIPINFSAADSERHVEVYLDLPPQATRHVSLRATQWVKARDGSMTADAIAPPSERVSLTIAPYSTTQVILWVDARRAQPPMASIEGKLVIESGKEENRSLPLTLEFADVGLPPSPIGLDTSNWAYFYRPGVKATTEGLEKEVRDNLRDYGMNTWHLDYHQTPFPKLDTNNRYLGFTEESEAAFTQVMELLKGHPGESFIIWLGFQRPEMIAALEKPGILESYLRDLSARLDGFQIPPQRRYLMFWDEPKLPEVRQTMAWMRRVKALGLPFALYENSSVVMSDEQEMKAYTSLCDVWMANWDQLFASRPEAARLALRFRPAKMGFYRCLMSRNNRGVNLYEYYRLMGWYAMRHGFNQLAFWVHNVGAEDPWDGTTGSSSGGMVIYRKDGQLYSSRRWELFRETLDDYRLVQAAFGPQTPDATRHERLRPLVDEVLDAPDDPRVADAVREKLINLALERQTTR